VWPEAEEGGWRLFVEFFEVFNCSALRIIDNNIDISHPAFVHRNTFGDPAQAAMLASRVEATDHGLVAQFHRSTPGVGKQTGASDDETVRFERTSELEVLAPLTTHLRLLYPDAPDYAFFGSATPVDDEHSIYMRLTALAGTEDQQPYAPFHEFGTRVKEEDRVILEATPVDFPIELTSEIHLRTDRTTIEYRRYLSRLAGLSRPSGGLVALEGASASTG
jgi:phenylpropionate dioxygenase-like ring-hydroxylating dioxygenase large terminal subunit